MSRRSSRQHLQRIAFGLLCALGGTALIFQLLDWMNGATPAPKPKRTKANIAFAVQRQPPPKPKLQTPPRRAPEPQRRQPRAPLPNLGSELSGPSFGIPTADAQAFGDAQKSLLGAASALRDVVMTARSVDQPPRPSQRVAPRYPPRARADGVTGHVKLRLLVGADGAVLQVKVVEAAPSGVFEQEATEAIRRWRFKPALYHGQPVKLWVTQTLRFDLG